MELDEAKQKFIQAWGTLGSNWGINRTMAQVHALLLISAEPLCADDIMEKLKISRGNANMNIRALIDWGLVFKELKPGERREYFISERDMWNVVRQIIIHRKKKELEPVLKVLDDVSKIEGESEDKEAFLDVIKDIQLFASKADRTLDKLVHSDANWLMKTFMKMM
ncbi:GbsR/MarR family transcriptional regulator [Aureispira anguillae]|uniref:HTH-type transcriptional regulator n=1 Tax=Aureispira anguillae TaxID=2864201 RepID=A0A915YK33_9BACT|nr:MarR family transcriptional regulator [Aureispira anguillae]BDS14683.1 transcriptional regulator [Aureispira anguillae]